MELRTSLDVMQRLHFITAVGHAYAGVLRENHPSEKHVAISQIEETVRTWSDAPCDAILVPTYARFPSFSSGAVLHQPPDL
jgi:hypothetical protein